MKNGTKTQAPAPLVLRAAGPGWTPADSKRIEGDRLVANWTEHVRMRKLTAFQHVGAVLCTSCQLRSTPHCSPRSALYCGSGYVWVGEPYILPLIVGDAPIPDENMGDESLRCLIGDWP